MDNALQPNVLYVNYNKPGPAGAASFQTLGKFAQHRALFKVQVQLASPN